MLIKGHRYFYYIFWGNNLNVEKIIGPIKDLKVITLGCDQQQCAYIYTSRTSFLSDVNTFILKVKFDELPHFSICDYCNLD